MPDQARAGEKLYRGIAVSAGVCRGKIFVLGKPDGAIPRRQLADSELPAELKRLKQLRLNGIHLPQKELDALRTALPNCEIAHSPDPLVQCSTAATAGSVDQAIQDGVVDSLNYSISGGTDPWNEPTSLAFLSATNAGIFVAAAAGNTGTSVPVALPGTVNHMEPWVVTVAASTHTGGAIAPSMSVTGPGTPPANTQNIPLTEANADTPQTAPLHSLM